MKINLVVSSFFTVFLFIGFILSIILHRRRLKQSLKIEEQKELSKFKYIIQPYLSIANIFFVLSFVSLILTLLDLQIPFTIASKSIYFDNRYIYNYQSWTDVLYDTLPIVFISISFSALYILKSQEFISYLFEFFAGLLIGYAFTVAYLLSLIGLGIGSLIFLIIVLFVFFAFGMPLASSIGLIIGFVISPLFVTATVPLVFKYITWLAFIIVLGVLSGCVFLFASESNLFFSFTILFALLIPFYLVRGFVEVLIFLFGISLVLVISRKFKDIVNVTILVVVIFILYLIAWPEYAVLISITFIIGLAFDMVFIAMLYKNSVRAVLIKWVQLSMKMKGEKIDLSEHESIPDFKRKWIKRESFFFTYLKYLILKPLEEKGLNVEIIEKDVNNTKYVKGIFVSHKS
ncbi:MAG: hypothetical protein DRO67_00780 [Candidatus Asgardarchaeum californiense]|nr:MAG: hypothetical protein DRO67_00780 [Candidatus Asgardarchaeum californiense]